MTFKSFLRASLAPVMSPLLTRRNQQLKPYAVILLYHSISDDTNITNPVNTATFRSHMDFLAKEYTVIPLNLLQESISSHKNNSNHYAIITFDDGYLDNYTNALPILDDYHLPSTFFLTTSEIGGGFSSRLKSQYDIEIPMMDWYHINQLLARGHLIGSHTVTHRAMQNLTNEQKIVELNDSQEQILANTGLLTRFFSFPYGDKHSYTYQDCLIASKFYSICCNNIRGKNTGKHFDPIDLHRYSITGSMGIHEFMMELKGCYDILEIFRI